MRIAKSTLLKTALVFSAMVLGLVPVAQSQVISGVVKKRSPVNFVPSYFFKTSPDGKYVAYTTYGMAGASANENALFNLETNVITPIPGPFDPMFNHNNRIMTMPYGSNGNFACAFYDQNEVITKGRAAKAKLIDYQMYCVYQSVGLLSTSPQKDIFRLMVESSDGLVIKDYEDNKVTGKVTSLSQVRPICDGFDLKLPMISKNGRELGAFNMKTNTSQILTIHDDGRCSVAFDLKIAGGKMSFSYDSKKVALHVFSNSSRYLVTEFMEIPEDGYTADIYLISRDVNGRRRITQNGRSNSLYPEFLADGTLIFVDHPHDQNQKVQFIQVKP